MGSVDVGTRTVTGTIYSADDIGAGHTFFVDDRKIKTTLAAVTDRTYFWVDNRLNVDFEVVQEAADRFEAEFYPVIVALFGEEWSPGVDGDPHFQLSIWLTMRAALNWASSSHPMSIRDRLNDTRMSKKLCL